MDAIASTSRGELLLKLPNVQSINDMYDSKIATNRKVNKLFQPQETGLEQDKCLGYLKQFVKGLDGPTLKIFLRHVTGAEICVDKIEVHYNNRRGIGRVPVVRTCTPMIELSYTEDKVVLYFHRKRFFCLVIVASRFSCVIYNSAGDFLLILFVDVIKIKYALQNITA